MELKTRKQTNKQKANKYKHIQRNHIYSLTSKQKHENKQQTKTNKYKTYSNKPYIHF